MIEECEMPTLLLTKKYANFKEDYTIGLLELLLALRKPPSSSGIVKYYNDFVDISDDWITLFNHSKNLNILSMYSQTWRNTYLKYLNEITMTKNGKITIILPDFNNKNLLGLYSERLQCDEADLFQRIQLAKQDYSEINLNGKVELYVADLYFNHAFYLFDNACIYATYSYEIGRVPTPAILLEDGQFMAFLKKDFQYLLDNKKLTKKIL